MSDDLLDRLRARAEAAESARDRLRWAIDGAVSWAPMRDGENPDDARCRGLDSLATAPAPRHSPALDAERRLHEQHEAELREQIAALTIERDAALARERAAEERGAGWYREALLGRPYSDVEELTPARVCEERRARTAIEVSDGG